MLVFDAAVWEHLWANKAYLMASGVKKMKLQLQNEPWRSLSQKVLEQMKMGLAVITLCALLTLNFSGSGEDSLDGLTNQAPRCPLTPSLSPPKRTTSQSKTEPPLLRTNKRTIYTAGRPPWYNVTGTTFKEAFVIGEAAHLHHYLMQFIHLPVGSMLNMRVGGYLTVIRA